MAKDLKILYLSSFFPRQCGIANFTQSLMEAIRKLNLSTFQKVIAVNERGEKVKYSPKVVFEIEKEKLESYEKAAAYINESGADLFCLQHEYNLFGGFDGIFVLKILAGVKIPIVSSLHTIPVIKDSKRRGYRLKILKKIAQFGKYIIVTAEIGKDTLVKECKVPARKIITIYHGAPDVSYILSEEREKIKEKFNIKGRFVVSTYGLLSSGKGIDYGIEAIGKLSKSYPEILYLIIGESHPAKREEYPLFELKVKKLKIKNNVLFINKYLSEKEIIDYLRLTDIYLMPSLTKTQISSGTLSYAMAAGTCVLSTPFVYAKELIGKDRGFFIDLADTKSIVKVISNLIENPERIEKTRKKAYEFARRFTWPEVAKKYLEVFSKAARNN